MEGQMLQSLFSLMLAAVQVLAWNAAPVYLCLEADGSTCVHQGPAVCDCCKKVQPSHNRCEDDCEHEHPAPIGSSDELGFGTAPCGCEHELISDAQAAVRGQDRSNFEFTASPPITYFCCQVAPASSACELMDAAVHALSSSPLAARAGVVLRL
jgi:hypothetical protein